MNNLIEIGSSSFFETAKKQAVLVDKYGGAAGIVTMEDLIEILMAVVLMDETDTVAVIRAPARQQWLKCDRSSGIAVDTEAKPFRC